MQKDKVHWCVPLVLVCLSAPGLAQAPDAAKARQQLAARISRDLDDLAANSQGLRRTLFTPADVVAAVGREHLRLHDWVRAATRWVPYRGCLRGAAGVLADGTGSSLDRSLLLAELLRTAGFEARLARGSLEAGLARRLAAELIAAPAPPTAAELPPSLGRDDEDALAMVAASEQLLLAACGAVPPAPTVDAAAVLQEHWWVQLRQGQGWLDLDLLADQPGQALAPAAATIAATARGLPIPAAEAHAVLVRVLIEQVVGSARQEHVVLRAELRPAEWVARPVELSFFAFAWPAGLAADGSPAALAALQQALLQQKEWMPILQLGDERVAKASFDASGAVDERPALDGREKLGRAAARGFDALGDTADAGPAGLLTALWLEFELRGPGLPARTVRHELFDLVGPDARAANRLPAELTPAQRLDRALALLAATEILPLGCQLPGALVARVDLERWLRLRPRARALQQTDAPAAFAEAFRALAADALQQSPTLAFAALRVGLGDGDVYLDRPNLVCSRSCAQWDGSGTPRTRLLIDVVANEVAVRTGPDPQRARLRQGAVDTAAEELAVGSAAGAAPGTLGVFARLGAHGQIPLILRHADDLAAVATWPADARARARAELLAGQLLLAAPSPVSIDGEGQLGWWRIDPRSGSAIGMMASGFRQGTGEYGETTTITSPLLRARRLLEFLAKPGNRNLIFRARNGSRIPANLAQEWEVIGQIQQRAAQALYEGFGVIG